MTIAIDIDEVLADTLNSYIKYHNNTYNTSLKREQFFTYNWWEVLQIEFNEGATRFNDFVNKGYFENLPLVKGAKQAVIKLKENHNLAIVTSRMGELKAITKKWINKNFPGCFLKIYHTKSVYDKNAITKHQACLKSRADILIEDDINFASECMNNGIKVLLVDRPWNRDFEVLTNAVRVHSWDDILQQVKNVTASCK
ncbi:MAG: hypothetical protein U9R14_04940 [Patescibacteria group bacterium]|nr:hypothetical protein [Patescibacteria group bacterium]